jgi:beta-propeller repeat-containing protein
VYPAHGTEPRSLAALVALIAVLPLVLAFAVRGADIPHLTQGPVGSASSQAYGKLPLSFVPNRGQSDSRVRYSAQAGGFSAFFTKDRVALAFSDGDKEGYALHLRFPGANPNPRIEALDRQQGKVSYIGAGSSQTNIPTFAELRYRNLWPGIDLAFRGAGGKLKYEFRLAPGADPSKIKLAYAGATGLSLAEGGALLVKTPTGSIRDAAPRSYQRIGGHGAAVDSRYVLSGSNRYGFALGSYDTTRPLVIDPGLAYSTFLGGSGFDGAIDIAVDDQQNAYVVGSTGSADFPLTPGSYQTSARSHFVTKLNPSGSSLVYSAFIPPTGLNATISANAVDADGNVYVVGKWDGGSQSFEDFPCEQTFKNPCGMVLKLNAAGSALVYSASFGVGTTIPGDVAADSAGNAYVTGYGGGPRTPGAYDTTPNGGVDAFVFKLNPNGTTLHYGTVFGGSAYDWGNDIAIDGDGAAYITGGTNSADLPLTPGAPDTAGAGDAYVAKLSPDGSALEYSTYLGGYPGSDSGASIDVDGAGNAYVAGSTQSAAFPTTPDSYDPSFNGDTDTFVTKLNPAGTAFEYSTYFGGPTYDSAQMETGEDGRAWLYGHTEGGIPTTADAMDPSFDSGDRFLARLGAGGSSLEYSSYFGPIDTASGASLALDVRDSPYLVGGTSSAAFPTTPGAYDTTYNGGADAFITKLDFPGKIVVVKDAVPNDPQNFAFTMGGPFAVAPFALDDDSDPAFSNTRVIDVPPRSGYSITEAVPAGWYQGQALCDDGSPPNDIDVSAAETVTCTFTNSKTYPRPGGASPLRVPLVPAYRVCQQVNANSQHVPPLDHPSCTPPVLASNLLTTSTTGRQAGSASFSVVAGNPVTDTDEADVLIAASVSDVKNSSDGTDYAGKLILTTTALRITDRANDTSGTASATMEDFEFALPIDCATTPGDPLAGSSCSVTSSADTLVPGFAKEGKRAVIRLQSVRMKDAGPDADVGPPATCPPTCGTGDERTYLDQGVFAP